MANAHGTPPDFNKLSAPQHTLLVHGYVRLQCSEDNSNIKQLVHEFYHKNVIVNQQQKDNADIEEYVGMEVGGHGGGPRHHVSETRELLTHLQVADLTLYKEDGISIRGYRFESDSSFRRCNLGSGHPEGLRNHRTNSLISRKGEYCNGVELFYGGSHDGIRGIRFTTNLERIIMVGSVENTARGGKNRHWKRTVLKLPHLQYGIIGFKGRSGWLLDQISFVFAPQ